MSNNKMLLKLHAWNTAFNRGVATRFRRFCDEIFETAIVLSLMMTVIGVFFALIPILKALVGLTIVLTVLGVTYRTINLGYGLMSIIGTLLYAISWVPYWYFYQGQSFWTQMISVVLSSTGILVWFLAFARSLQIKKAESHPRRVAELRVM